MQNENSVSKKSKRPRGSMFLYAAAIVVAIMAIALLISNILMFKSIVNQYSAQGYDPSEVVKQLIPTQLIPSVFEPIGIYGGIAALLFGLGMIYQRISKDNVLLAEVEENAGEEMLLEEEPSEIEAEEVELQLEADGDSK